MHRGADPAFRRMCEPALPEGTQLHRPGPVLRARPAVPPGPAVHSSYVESLDSMCRCSIDPCKELRCKARDSDGNPAGDSGVGIPLYMKLFNRFSGVSSYIAHTPGTLSVPILVYWYHNKRSRRALSTCTHPSSAFDLAEEGADFTSMRDAPVSPFGLRTRAFSSKMPVREHNAHQPAQ
jgi:hypothetical protein